MRTVEQVRRAVARAADRDATALEQGGPEALARHTRCSGWDVATLAQHVVWGMTMQADGLRRSRESSTGLAVGAQPGHGQLADEIRSAAALLDTELAMITSPERLVPMPYGDVPTAIVLQIIAMEAGVHADDLAAASGREERLDPDVIAATAVVLRAFLPVLATGATERPAVGTSVALTGPTVDLRFVVGAETWAAGDTLTVTGGVEADDDTAVLRFALGRITAAAPELTVVGDPVVSQRFKLWFPGP